MNYYLYQNQQTLGPYTREHVLKLQSQGDVTLDTPCCQEGDTAWQTVAAFFSALTTTGHSIAGGAGSLAGGRFQHSSYLLRRKVFSFLGASFHVYDPSGAVAFFSKQKAFKLREDIRIYSDESMSEEVLTIKARQIMDFSAAYDIFDPILNVKVGALRRKGFSSILRDAWQLLDAEDQEIGQIQEDHMALALIRRLLSNLIPQHFILKMGDKTVADYRQRLNPFIFKLEMDFSQDTSGKLDRRLGAAAGILLAAIEGRQG
jgi:uncharacterized protein YxjI